MGSSVQLWKDGRRSDHIHRLRFGRLQRDSKVIKHRRDIARQTHSEGTHAQAKYHRKEQCRGRTVRSSIGSVQRELCRC